MKTISCTVLWNAFKRMTASFTAAEREMMFARVAAKTYRIEH